jgi:hypothetical protein
MSAAQNTQAREQLCVEAPPAVQAAHNSTQVHAEKKNYKKNKLGATSCASALSAQPITWRESTKKEVEI